MSRDYVSKKNNNSIMFNQTNTSEIKTSIWFVST